MTDIPFILGSKHRLGPSLCSTQNSVPPHSSGLLGFPAILPSQAILPFSDVLAVAVAIVRILYNKTILAIERVIFTFSEHL